MVLCVAYGTETIGLWSYGTCFQFISEEEWLECFSAVYTVQSLIPRYHRHSSSKTLQITAVTGNRLVTHKRGMYSMLHKQGGEVHR